MKQNKTKMALVAKVFGGLCLVALLVFNITSVVNNESSSGLSLSSLMASASAQGEGDSGNKKLYGESCFEVINGKVVITKTGNTCIKGGQACTPNPVGDCGV
ncbi:MAG TPA: hypothetical protein VL125_17460 [Pelobium sp.]|nr:hypothetical protein [Pelobium sp.]